MTDKPMNRRQLSKVSTTAKMTVAAREIFSTTPYYKADIRQIADKAGMSTGAFFQTWPNGKAQCWEEVMKTPAPIDSSLTRAAPALLKALEMVRDADNDAGQMSMPWSARADIDAAIAAATAPFPPATTET